LLKKNVFHIIGKTSFHGLIYSRAC